MDTSDHRTTNMARDLALPNVWFERKFSAFKTDALMSFRLRHVFAALDRGLGWLEDRALGAKATRPIVAPVFITGNFRSGTTLLEKLLSAHASFGHFTYLTTLMPTAPHSARWVAERVPGFSNVVTPPHQPNLRVDATWPFEGESIWRWCKNNLWRDVPRNDLDAEFSDPAFERVLARTINKHLESQGATRFLNKNPPNTLRVGYLANLYPDAKFVHIVRDPRRVLRSQLDLEAMWKRLFADQRARDWNRLFSDTFFPPGRLFLRTARYDEIMSAYATDPALGVARSISDFEEVFRHQVERNALDARVRTIRYEDLLANPKTVLRELWDFLEIDGDSSEMNPEGLVDRRLVSNSTEAPTFEEPVLEALRPFARRHGYRLPSDPHAQSRVIPMAAPSR